MLYIAASVISGVLIVAMAVAVGFLFNERADLADGAVDPAAQTEMRGCLIGAAESTMNDMMNLSAENVDDKFQSLLDGSTGSFHAQVDGARAQYVAVTQEADARTEGAVIVSAVEESSDTGGTVLVVTEGDIDNANIDVPRAVSYRAKVTVEKADGVCKTSDVVWVTE